MVRLVHVFDFADLMRLFLFEFPLNLSEKVIWKKHWWGDFGGARTVPSMLDADLLIGSSMNMLMALIRGRAVV